MSTVLVLGTEISAADWIGAALFLGVVFAVPVAYLLHGEVRRSELRTGSRWDGLVAPIGFVAVVIVALVSEGAGRAAAMAVLVGFYVALGAVAALKTHREKRDRPPPPPPPPPIDALPAEYRFLDGGGSLAGWGIPLAILVIGGLALGDGQLGAGIILGLALLASAIGLTVVFRRRRRRQKEIIADVERRAADLPREDLRKLVELLEEEHGHFEMRRLRRLVA